VASVGTFWRSYLGTWQATRRSAPARMGTHVMLGVIGTSTALEYGLKGLYEKTIGRLSEAFAPPGGTAEDRYAAQVAEDYAKLINEKGWYEFGFGAAFKHLWTDVPLLGPGLPRKLERRYWLSTEYGFKAVYAWLIGIGTGAGYAPDESLRYLVVAGWSDSLVAGVDSLRRVAWLDRRYALLSVPRYAAYRDALLKLSVHATRLRAAEVSGNRVVTLTGLAPEGWRAPARSRVVLAYVAPAQPGQVRVLLAVDARDLLDVLAALGPHRFAVDHIYDY
jgi:hypothetical protein